MKRSQCGVHIILVVLFLAAWSLPARAQENPPKPPAAPDNMLEQGVLPFYFEVPGFVLKLMRSSQTVVSMKPRAASGFDFAPADLLPQRFRDGYAHLGDLNLRLRSGANGAWINYSTYMARKPVTALPTPKPEFSPDGPPPALIELAKADLGPTLPVDCPLQVIRTWSSESGNLVLRFELKNKSAAPVQIGALGMPMIFNNAIIDRELEEAHVVCSFMDPYIGMDAGYLQVTRLSGKGPVLLVVPDGKTPFEAYAPLLNPEQRRPVEPLPVFTDLTPRGQTFEGFMDWTVYSQAYAENEWKNTQPWNRPSSLTLAPGETKIIGLKFLVCDEIRNIEKTLAENHRPLAVGIPGYILPMDLEGKLFLRYGQAVKSLTVEPQGALTAVAIASAPAGYAAYQVRGKKWGRSRLSITYTDGTVQTIQYYVTKPAAEVVADMGRFLTTKDWFVDAKDPFGRSPSVMTYDREKNEIVTQCQHAWVCGLGDEGGATWLAEAMKLFGQPQPQEIAKYQQFIDQVLWGNLQYKDGPLKYGIKRTLFYYEPTLFPAGFYRSDINWKTWMAWSKEHILEVPRTYNYPHVAALYWSMYRLARNHSGLVTNHPWQWYIEQAYRTVIAMCTLGTDYINAGVMEGTVFLYILQDLKREGLIKEAADLEARMKLRADLWRTQEYPFGSEMAWDSTGQEEVYAWTKYFGDASKAKVCIDAILGYMPAIPHWGYNGCARRYWDFIYGGAKIGRLERMIHHYGSSMNAIPILSEYRDHPEDLYLLRVGYGGMMGSLSNIDQTGFPSMGFHSFPDTLKWDPISGDYGPNFFGHAMNSATYLVKHPEFGWQAFGGNLKTVAGMIVCKPLDSFRNRFYVAPFGLWLTLDAGKFASVEVNPDTHVVRIVLDPADRYTANACLRVEQPSVIKEVGKFNPTKTLAVERDAYVMPLNAGVTWIELSDKTK